MKETTSCPALPSRQLHCWFYLYFSVLGFCAAVCVSFPRDRCLSKDRVWHSRGIWCLRDCIKRMCGLRQRWTGTNPAAAFALDCSMPPSYLGGFRKKCLQCSLKTCHPSHMLRVIFLFFFSLPSPSSTHDYVPWSITHFRTLWSFHIKRYTFSGTWNLGMVPLLLLLLPCLLLLHHSFCSSTSPRSAKTNTCPPSGRAVIE